MVPYLIPILSTITSIFNRKQQKDDDSTLPSVRGRGSNSGSNQNDLDINRGPGSGERTNDEGVVINSDPNNGSWLSSLWSNDVGGLKGLLSALTGYFLRTNLTGAEREQNAFNAEQAQINRDYQTEMSNTSYQRAVADMQAAGLNPALMYGSASGSSVPSGTVASGSTGGSAGLGELFNFILESKRMDLQERISNNQIRNDSKRVEIESRVADSNIRKSEAETEGIKGQNSWLDVLNQAALDEKDKNIEFTDARIEEIKSAIKQREVEMRKLEAEIKTEAARELYTDSMRRLNEATIAEKNYLLEANRAYLLAKTDSERAQALAVSTKQQIDAGLLSMGYVQSYLRDLNLRADNQELKNAIDEFSVYIREGRPNEWHLDNDYSRLILRDIGLLLGRIK